MARLPLLILFALTSGCASSPAHRISFSEAFAQPPAVAVAVAEPAPTAPTAIAPVGLPVERAQRERPAEAAMSPELRAELVRFQARSRKVRHQALRGSPMPGEQEENWRRVLDALDDFLERPPAATVAADVARARVAAEAELELDARTWGELPPPLAERVLDRVNRLATRMAEVRQLGTRSRKGTTRFDWPVQPVRITSLFGRRVHPIDRTWRVHSGVDLGAYAGQLVTAAAGGTVLRAGWNGAHGIQVELEHPGGLITRYSHLSGALVQPGRMVQQGDPIGLAGRSGMATGVHLHFELWRAGRPVDPLEALVPPDETLASSDLPRS